MLFFLLNLLLLLVFIGYIMFLNIWISFFVSYVLYVNDSKKIILYDELKV